MMDSVAEMNHMMDMCHFIGDISSLDATGKLGDIALHGTYTYIFDGTKWIQLSDADPGTPEKREAPIAKVITQCRNCGAPTHSDGKCPYCGTVNIQYE